MSKISEEEMEKRRNRDQIAHDRMISEGAPIYYQKITNEEDSNDENSTG